MFEWVTIGPATCPDTTVTAVTVCLARRLAGGIRRAPDSHPSAILPEPSHGGVLDGRSKNAPMYQPRPPLSDGGHS